MIARVLLIIFGGALILLGFVAIPITLSANDSNFAGGIIEDVFCGEEETMSTMSQSIDAFEESIHFYCGANGSDLREVTMQVALSLTGIVLVPSAIGGLMIFMGVRQLVKQQQATEKFSFD